MKTTLRYLLMIVAMVSVLSVKAQSTAQLPEVQMQSTSVMMSSGSTLPQAATTGAHVTGSAVGSYSPVGHHGHIRRDVNPGGGFNPDGDDNENDRDEPWKNPIGDALWPLMVLACAYLIIRVGRKRARA